MKKLLFLLPVITVLLLTGCDLNKKETKQLNCSTSFETIETSMDMTFKDDKFLDISGSMTIVFDSEEEAKTFDPEDEDMTGGLTSGYAIDKIEGTKVTLKMAKEAVEENKKSLNGMSYSEVKEMLEQMSFVCK